MINNKFKDVGLDTKRHNIIIKIFYAILFAVICFLCFLQIKLDSKNTLNFLLSAFIIVGLLILLLYQENMRKRLYKSAYFDDVIDGENLKYMQYYVEKELKKIRM